MVSGTVSIIRRSHAPHIDVGIAHRYDAMEDLVCPGAVAAVEDHEMARLCRAAVHVVGGLLDALGDGLLQTLVQNFAFDHETARPIPLGPDDEQVRAPTAQAVFAFDASAAVHHAL